MVWDERREIGHSLKAESIRRECEASLRRLRVDALDLYQIHWPDPDEDIEEGWATMAALQRGGQGPQHRRVQFQRRPDEAGSGDRPDHVPPAARTR